MSDKDSQKGLGYQPVELTDEEKEAYYHEKMLNLVPEDLPEHLSEAWLINKQEEALAWLEARDEGDTPDREKPGDVMREPGPRLAQGTRDNDERER